MTSRLEIVQKCKDFYEELCKENYIHLIGLKDELNETEIYQKYSHMFTKDNISFIKSLNEKFSWLERRKNNFLLSFMIGNFIGLKLSKISDEAALFSARATIKFSGNEVPYRGIKKLVSEEPIKENRDLVYELEKPIKQKLLKYSSVLLKKKLRILKDFGYKNYIEYVSSIKDMDYHKFKDELVPFLRDTDYEYSRLINNSLKSIGLEIGKATHYDYIFLARKKKFDRHFPKEMVVETLKKTLLGMGFNLDGQKNIELDIEDREKKVPRAFMMHIKVPEDIKLVIKPQGGYDDYHAILHEAGHCEHYAHVDSDLDFEFKNLGDHAVSEIFSFLFDFLLQDENWLKTYTKMNSQERKEFLEFIYLNDLYLFRRYIAKLIYELKLFGNDLSKLDNSFNITKGKYNNFGECYGDILTKATKFKFPMNSYLLDVDSGFYVADYLRAWIAERQLRHKLRQEYGLEWFKNKKVGEFLKRLYSYGNSKSIYELMQEAGFDGLDTTYIFKDFKDFLNNHF